MIKIYYLAASLVLTILYKPLMPSEFNLPLKSPTPPSITGCPVFPQPYRAISSEPQSCLGDDV